MATKTQNNPPKRAWQRVKIKGNVISDDGGGLEGLIGLEVLESYDKNLVQREKKTKKQMYLEQHEAKREDKKRNALDKKVQTHSRPNAEDDKPPKPKKAKKNQITLKTQENQLVDNYPGRFVLLKPPTKQQTDDELYSEGFEKTNSSIDELQNWNGLGVPEIILKALAAQGFKSPTPIQSLTLPAAIMGKKDILGAAETGSGKTLAFGIPILTGILELKQRHSKTGIRKVKALKNNDNPDDRDNLTPPPDELDDYPAIEDDYHDRNHSSNDRDKPLYALILTPTRELAVQVKDHIVATAKYTGIKVATIFGGMASVKQERILRQCPEIVVATPGRLWELLEQGNSHLSKVDDISFLVIDETDRMVEKGHFDELRMLMDRLNMDQTKKERRQNFIFSATLTMVHDLPDHLQRKNKGRKQKFVKQTPGMKIQTLIESLGISHPKIVDITSTNQTAQTLTECRLVCPIDHKDYYLYYFVQRHSGRTIVFCNSIDCVKRLAQLFGLLNCQPLPLHANMIQKQRLKNLEKFRSNPCGLLIATDVAARGLDIPDVQHVIHYQIPRTSENYVHRSGRTARANKDGITIMIMEPGEMKNYLKLCKTLDRSEDIPLFPVSERHLSAVRERVNIARDVDKMELKLKREMSEIGWLTKTAEEMDIVLDHEKVSDDEGSEDDENILKKNRDKRILIAKRQQLKNLLNKPLFAKGFSYKYPTSGGKLEIPIINMNASNDSAIRVMKNAIEEYKEEKKRRNKKKK